QHGCHSAHGRILRSGEALGCREEAFTVRSLGSPATPQQDDCHRDSDLPDPSNHPWGGVMGQARGGILPTREARAFGLWCQPVLCQQEIRAQVDGSESCEVELVTTGKVDENGQPLLDTQFALQAQHSPGRTT
ncbi:unnamed protein product, partial [Ectocarpus sp. 4 AP-2014]